MAGAPLDLTVDQANMAAVARALKGEADGKLLRRELVRSLKATTAGPIGEAKAEMLSTPSRGLTSGQSLRSTVANSIKPVSRLSGASTGVSIRQTRTPELRNFKMAGRRFNRASFRRRVFGSEGFVVQVGNPRWFDDAMQDAKPEFKADVVRVVQELADTLAQRARAAAGN